MSKPIEIFFSYAQEDELLCNELEKHLSLLYRQDLITGWHHRLIAPGTDWTRVVDKHLEEASIILLLVSADFLASDYCYGIEMQRAMARHEAGEARVIPVILRPVDWHTAPFGKLQALPANAQPVTSWTKRDEAFANIAQEIRAVVQDLTTSSQRLTETGLALSKVSPEKPKFLQTFLPIVYTQLRTPHPSSRRLRRPLLLLATVLSFVIIALILPGQSPLGVIGSPANSCSAL